MKNLLLHVAKSERGARARAHVSNAPATRGEVSTRDDSPNVARVPVSLLAPSLELADPPPGVFGRKSPDEEKAEKPEERARAVRIGQLTGGVVPRSSNRGWWDFDDVDFDPYYGRQTRTRSVELANIARTDLGVPLAVGDGKMLLFFGDTWDHDLDRNPGFFDSGDPYGWTDANLDVFLTAPRIRWVVTSEPTYDQRGRRVSGPGYVPLLRGVLTDRELGGACGPLGAFYDAARDTAYVFFVAQVTIIPGDQEPREDWCPAGDECVRLDRTVVVAARGVTSALTDPPSVPSWEVVAQHTAAPLKAVAPVLVSRAEIEPSRAREAALADIGVTARARAVADAPHHARATPRSARLSPGTDPVVLMFASDKRYRHSKIVLARCPLGELDPKVANPNAAAVATTVLDIANEPPSRRFQYLQWVDYSAGPPGVPFWTEDERLAMPLVDNETFGQPHVVREPRTGLWLMTDEGGFAGKSGIAMRWASNPWGPWGNTTAINPYTGAKERLAVEREPVRVRAPVQGIPSRPWVHHERVPQ